MELNVWPAGFGLNSWDLESLATLTLVKISGAPVQVKKAGISGLPWGFPPTDFPHFSHGESVQLNDFASVAKHLEKVVPGLAVDGETDALELAAFSALIQESLHPAYLYTFWAQPTNYATITGPWYAEQLWRPFSIHYTTRRRRQALAYLHATFPGELVTETDLQVSTHHRACRALNLLSARLANRKYLFGDAASSVDALLYAYLAVFLRSPLPLNPIAAHIKGCPELVRLVEALGSRAPLSLPESQAEAESRGEWERRAEEAREELHAQNTPATNDEEEFPLRNKIFFATTSIVLSILAALHFGLIRVEVSEESPPEAPAKAQLPPEMDFQGLLHGSSES